MMMDMSNSFLKNSIDDKKTNKKGSKNQKNKN